MHLKFLPLIMLTVVSAWSCSGSDADPGGTGGSTGGTSSTGGSSGSGGSGTGGSTGGTSSTGGSGGSGGSGTGGSTGGTSSTGGGGGTSGTGGSGGASGTGGNGGSSGAGGRGGSTVDAGGNAGSGGAAGATIDAGQREAAVVRNEGGAPRPEGGATGMLSYRTDVDPIMRLRCVGCHGNDGGLAISYATLVTNGAVTAARANCMYLDTAKRRVVPGNADTSFLWIKLSHTTAQLTAMGCGQHMPEGNNALTQAQLDTIQNWIIQGALP